MFSLSRKWFGLLAFLFFMAAFNACSDNPASPGSDIDDTDDIGNNNGGDDGGNFEDNPYLPEIGGILEQLDLSFFEFEFDDEENIDFEEYSGYLNAQNYSATTTFVVAFSSFGYLPYLSLADGQEPEFKNGKWIWEYSFTWDEDDDYGFGPKMKAYKIQPKANETLSIRLTSWSENGGVVWNLHITGALDDQVVSEFLMIEGFVTEDEKEGYWNFYSPEVEDQPLMKSEWKIESDTKWAYTITFVDDEDDGLDKIELLRDGPENWISFSDTFDSIEVYWNDETGYGWYASSEDGKTCFDRNNDYKNTACVG